MSKVKDLAKKSLSDSNIMTLIKGKARIISYPNLTKFNNLDDLMGKYNAVVILYETKKKFGHWTLLFKLNHDTVEFFDSYSMLPDDELKFIPHNFRMSNNELLPHLTYLLYSSGYQVEYNDYPLQNKKQGVNTCGRHVATRLLHRNLNIDEYVKMIERTGMDTDDFVTLFTNNISNHII